MASCDGMYLIPNAAHTLIPAKEEQEEQVEDAKSNLEQEEDAKSNLEQEEEQEEEEEEEEELELFEVEIKGKTYVTNDETNGDIYEYANDEVGEIVGAFKNGVAKFAKKQKSKTLQSQ